MFTLAFFGASRQSLFLHSLPSSSRKISPIGLLKSSFGAALYSSDIDSRIA